MAQPVRRLPGSTATRADVARAADVSVAVVSYVVNDGPRRVSDELRERVLLAIEATGYRPNRIASALAAGTSGIYGLIVPDVSNAFFAALAHALEVKTRKIGKVLLLANSAQSRDREVEIIDKFIQQRVDGMFYVGAAHDHSLRAVHHSGIPVVTLDRVQEDSPASSVSIDNIEGARMATSHLLEHGFERVGLISGPLELSTAEDRRTGWARALAQAGYVCDEGDVAYADFSRAGGLKAGRDLLSRRPDLKAIFVASDQMTLGVMKALREADRHIPRDLALVTFDGTSDTEYYDPPLTTVAQPIREMASKAVELMRTGMDLSGSPARITCSAELVIRDSCGCTKEAV